MAATSAVGVQPSQSVSLQGERSYNTYHPANTQQDIFVTPGELALFHSNNSVLKGATFGASG